MKIDNMEIKIRKATIKDVRFLVPLAIELMDHNRSLAKNNKLRQELLKLVSNIRPLWKKWVTTQMRSHNGYVIIATHNDHIVGYSLNYIKDNTKVYVVKKTGHVGDLYIKRGYRNKRIATKFKDLAFKWFKKRGIKYVSIAVHAENKKAHKIYKKWGFLDYHTEMRLKI